MWENGGVVSKSFKIIQKLPLLKKIIFFSLCVWEFSLPEKTERKNMFFFLLSENESKEIYFSSFFLLKVLFFFFLKMKSKVVVLWENNSNCICSSIHDMRYKNWSMKQPIWILGISQGNREALFFIILGKEK